MKYKAFAKDGSNRTRSQEASIFPKVTKKLMYDGPSKAYIRRSGNMIPVLENSSNVEKLTKSRFENRSRNNASDRKIMPNALKLKRIAKKIKTVDD